MSDYRDLDWEMFTGHMFSKKELDEIYQQGIADERERIVSLVHEFFGNEMDKLETDYDGIDEYYKDTNKVDELLSMNKRLCEIVRGGENE